MNRADILNTALQAVTIDREASHGDPEDNFGLIAQYWSLHLGVVVRPMDVAMMMVMLKLARIKTGEPRADHFADIAGYAACGGELAG